MTDDNIKVPDADELLKIVHSTMAEHCLHCGEFGCGGQLMNCGFEETAVLAGWRGEPEAFRVRCMLRSWIDAYVTGCDPRESEMGTVTEKRVHGVG